MKSVALVLLTVIGTAAQPTRYKFPLVTSQPPVAITKVEPTYSSLARKAGIEGTVLLYSEIGVDGRPRRIHVIKRLGYGLDAKAVEAMRRWRFQPGTKNGTAVRTPATIEINFRLKNSDPPSRV